jgi:hypothetical protein
MERMLRIALPPRGSPERYELPVTPPFLMPDLREQKTRAHRTDIGEKEKALPLGQGFQDRNEEGF